MTAWCGGKGKPSRWPCLVCKKGCATNAIFCKNCCEWSHYVCENLERRRFSTAFESFLWLCVPKMPCRPIRKLRFQQVTAKIGQSISQYEGGSSCSDRGECSAQNILYQTKFTSIRSV